MQDQSKRITLTIGGYLVYALTAFLLYPFLGRYTITLSFLPAWLAIRQLGTRGLVFNALPVFFGFALLALKEGAPPSEPVQIGFWIWHILVTIGSLIGLKLLKANQYLQANDQRYQALVENSPYAIMVHQQGAIVFANQVCCQLLGATHSSDIIGKGVLEFVHPNDQTTVANRIQHILRTTESAEKLEERFLRLDGETIHVEVTGSLVQFNRSPAVQVTFQDISRRKSAENILRADERRFRALTEYGGDVIVIIGADGHSKYVAPSIEPITGYKPAEIVDDFRRKLLTEESRLYIEDLLHEIMKKPGKRVLIDVFKGKHRSGELRYYAGTATNMLDVPDVQGIVFNVRDVTEQVTAEKAFKTSEQRYRTLFNHSSDAIFIYSRTGTIINANQQAADLLGYSLFEIIGLKTEHFIIPEEIVEARQIFNKADQNLRLPVYERTLLHKDGTHIPTEVDTTYFTEEMEDGSKHLRIQSIIRDISERKKAQEALLEYEYRYKALFNQQNDAVVLVGDDGKIINTNQRFSDLFGYHEAEVIGLNIRALLKPEDIDSAKNRIDRLVAGEKLPVSERDIKHKSGVFISTEVNPTIVRNTAQQPLYVQIIMRDITARKREETELKHQAMHDPLTGLHNRSWFYQHLKDAMKNAAPEQRISLFFIDLDSFKPVNDKHGHNYGDLLLVQVAERIRKSIRDQDTATRMGGDEFIVMVDHVGSIKALEKMARRILNTIAQPYYVNDEALHISCSIGISVFPYDANTFEELVERADEAMYRAKNSGKNQIAFNEDIND